MVAPAPTGASGMRTTPTAQEPLQAGAENKDKSTEPGRATPHGIMVDLTALVVTAAGEAIDSASVLTNTATPQHNASSAGSILRSPAAFVTYETALPPDNEPEDESDDDLSDPVYRDFILNATEDELAEYEAAIAQERPQAEIETYADFLTAAYGPKSDDSDDEH